MPARLAFRTILGSSENSAAFETMLPLTQGCLCARDRNRTCDLRVTSALLYRLSYTGGGLKLAPHWAGSNKLADRRQALRPVGAATLGGVLRLDRGGTGPTLGGAARQGDGLAQYRRRCIEDFAGNGTDARGHIAG